MPDPEISVVIRTFNEEKYLPALLEALNHQSLNDFETIVVDSGSLDRTREIAAQKADQLLRIQSHDFTFGHSLNVGIRMASGKYIVIVSAHTLPASDQWLVKLVEPMHNNRTAMVYGRQLGGDASKFSEIQDMRRTFGSRREILQPPKFFANNANSAIRKDLWQQHPFDESLPGLEDIEWAKYWMERNYQVVYEPAAALYHIHEENWRQVRRRFYREAIAARRIGIKNLKHAGLTLPIETIYTLLDLGSGCFTFNKSRQKTRKYFDFAREAMLFRINKTIGTVKGLLDGNALENQTARQNIYFDRTCKAVVIHGAGRASLDEVEVPEVKPGDVMIRVAYVSICATDLEILDGTLGYYKDGIAKYPIVPGHEFSGRVVAFGPNVSHLQEGDPVVVECIQSCGVCEACKRQNWIACQSRTELGVIGHNGGYSELVVVPGHFVHRLPADFDLRKASLCEPMAVVLKGIRRLERALQSASDSQRCAVVGAGPLGNLCAQTLALRGHQVTVFDRNPRRLEYLSDLKISSANDLNQLHKYDVLVEVTGDPDALDGILHNSPAGATILLLGLPYAHRQFTFEKIVAFDKTVVGSVGSSAKDFADAIALLPQLETTSFFEKVLPLSDFANAWELARSQKYLKVIFDVSGQNF
jgi:2-desacetyl-2-hydroxyethyl bacteriochlorophyllide A dehydrogenase